MSTPDGYINVEVDVDASKAEKELNSFEKTGNKTAENIEDSFEKTGDSVSDSMKKTQKESSKSFSILDKDSAAAAGAIAGVFAGVASKVTQMFIDMAKQAVQSIKQIVTDSVKLYADFDDSMRQVQATLGIYGDEGAATLQQLEEAAREAGATTRYTASDAAEALNYMALAGYDAQKSINTMPKVLKLAAAGNLDIAYTSDMVTDAMAALQLEEKELDKLMNQMAKTSQRTNTSIGQLGEAILAVGGQIPASNQELETMNTALGLLANTGIKAAEGGTALRNILSLTKSNADNIKKTTGVDIYDQQTGKMRDILEIMNDINEATKDMNDAQKDAFIEGIYGRYNTTAALNLMGEIEKNGGFEGLSEGLRQEVVDALDEDTITKISDVMEGGLGGLFRTIISMGEELMIVLGKGLQPVLTVIGEIAYLFMQNLQPALEKFFGSFSDEHLGAFKTMLTYIADVLSILIIYILEVASVTLPLLADAFTLVVRVLSPFWDIMKRLVSLITGKFITDLKALEPLIRVVFTALGELLDELAPTFEWLWKQINRLLTALETLQEGWRKVSKSSGEEFETVKEDVEAVTDAVHELDEELNKLDGKTVNTTVNTNFTTTGSSSGGGGGGGSSGGGGGSSYADTVYAGTGMSYDARTNNYTTKKGTEISADKIKSRSDAVAASRFHTGGIVEGVGDVPALLEAGEMVLTKPMQSKLFGMISGGNLSSGGGSEMNYTEIVNALMEAIRNTPLSITSKVNAIFDKRQLSKELIPEFESELKRLGKTI